MSSGIRFSSEVATFEIEEQTVPAWRIPPCRFLSKVGKLSVVEQDAVGKTATRVPLTYRRALYKMAGEYFTDPVSESEHRYRTLRAAVSDYHYHVEIENGQILRKVHGISCQNVTGYSAEEFIADPVLWMAIVAEEDRPVIQQQIASIISRGLASTVEYRIHRKDGSLRWIRKTVVPYHDQSGNLIAYDGLLRDVTRTKCAEEDLRQSEERFRLIFEDDLTGDYLADPDGRILLCNHSFAGIFGFRSPEDAVGARLANLYGDPTGWPSFIQRLMEYKTLERCERAGRHSDGTIRYVVESVLGTFDADGRLIRIKGYVYDDTDSRIKEARLRQRNVELEDVVARRTQALREKHEHLQAIWNSAFDAIVTIDSRGTIETVNHAAELMFGYSAAEMEGQNVRMLMPSPYCEEHDAYLERYRQTGIAGILNVPRELIALRKDGSTFPIDLSVTQVDQSEYFTGIIRDCSERKELQKHILDIAAEEQRRIGLELHDGVGQELTGLSLVAGTLCSLLSRLPGADQQDRLLSIAELLNRKLSGLNRQIHQLSHGIMPVQIDVESLRSALEELAATTNASEGIDCRFLCTTPVIAADNTTATHLYRIAQEAISNAVRHSQAQEILISLRQNESQIVLEVCDNGVGINVPGEELTPSGKLRGMGLRTMRYRAGLIGGSLQVERRAEGGTRIRCTSLVRRDQLP